MNKYQDKFTRYHDKECVYGEPSSNNGWIYSAYAKYLAKNTTSYESLQQCYNQCMRNYSPLKIDRSPNDKYPPLSKDEVIGLVSIGFLSGSDLEANHWNFCNLEYEPKKLTLITFLKAFFALFKIRKEDRNYFWENEVVETYPLAFYLPPWDQYYVRKMIGKRPNLLQTLSFYINYLNVLTNGNKSVRMLLWLQLEDMNHTLLRYIPRDEYVRNYFEQEHVFVKGLE
jgi:hypothetical protein